MILAARSSIALGVQGNARSFDSMIWTLLSMNILPLKRFSKRTLLWDTLSDVNAWTPWVSGRCDEDRRQIFTCS